VCLGCTAKAKRGDRQNHRSCAGVCGTVVFHWNLLDEQQTAVALLQRISARADDRAQRKDGYQW
jgi:hypothetical protein